MKSLARLWKKDPKFDSGATYSQCGEDVIIDYAITRKLKIQDPQYLDIGANHPTWLSNTYLYYQRGCRGVCVEPDADLCNAFKKARKRDICINVGVGVDDRESADFYLMHPSTVNTFSKAEAEKYAKVDTFKIREVRSVPLVSINDLIRNYFDRCPDLISLDTEGHDLAILKTFDFSLYRPAVFCVETLSVDEDQSEHKIKDIEALMLSKGYFVYADTYINTIFVDRYEWNKAA